MNESYVNESMLFSIFSVFCISVFFFNLNCDLKKNINCHLHFCFYTFLHILQSGKASSMAPSQFLILNTSKVSIQSHSHPVFIQFSIPRVCFSGGPNKWQVNINIYIETLKSIFSKGSLSDWIITYGYG